MSGRVLGRSRPARHRVSSGAASDGVSAAAAAQVDGVPTDSGVVRDLAGSRLARRIVVSACPVAGLVYLASIYARPAPGHAVVWDDVYYNAVSWAAVAVSGAGAWLGHRLARQPDTLVAPAGPVVAGASVASEAAMRARRVRGANWVLTVALASYSTGNTVWSAAIARLDNPPYPSIADGFWLAFYPLLAVGVFMLAGVARREVSRLQRLDGLTAALSLTALGVLVSVGPISSNVTGAATAVAVNMAYPLADLMLIIILVVVVTVHRRLPVGVFIVLAVTIAVWTVTDSLYVFRVAAGTYEQGTLLDAGWLVPLTWFATVPWLTLPLRAQPEGRAADPTASGGTSSAPRAVAARAVASRRLPPEKAVLLSNGAPGSATRGSGERSRWFLTLVAPVGLSGVCLVLLAVRGLDEAAWFSVLASVGLAVMGLRLVLTLRQVEGLLHTEREARTDPLTGLGNRRALTEELAARHHTGSPFTLLLMDLDGFKDVNDTLGHEAGDECLRQIGHQMAATVRGADQVFRLGGDEFAVLMVEPGDTTNPAAAAGLVARLTGAVARPIHIGTLSVSVGTSIGSVTYPHEATDPSEALRKADIAMYHAKRNRLGSARWDADLDAASQRTLTLAVQLRHALQDGQFTIEYQPVVDLHTDRVLRLEALLRWNHPDLGRLLPDSFLDVVTHAGQHEALTRFVLETVAAQHEAWQKLGLRVPVSVNTGHSDLHLATVADILEEVLGRRPLPAGLLLLEVTEDVLIRSGDRAADQLNRIRALGAPVVLDNFGQGFSSLGYLRDLPLDEVKLDRSVIAQTSHDPVARSVVEQTLRLSERLGLRTVAAGIETDTTRNDLASLGFRFAQGHLWAPAVPPHAIPGLMQPQGHHTTGGRTH